MNSDSSQDQVMVMKKETGEIISGDRAHRGREREGEIGLPARRFGRRDPGYVK